MSIFQNDGQHNMECDTSSCGLLLAIKLMEKNKIFFLIYVKYHFTYMVGSLHETIWT